MCISGLPRNLFCYLVVQTRLLIGGRGGGGFASPPCNKACRGVAHGRRKMIKKTPPGANFDGVCVSCCVIVFVEFLSVCQSV